MKKLTHLLVDLDGTLVKGGGLAMKLDFLARTFIYWKKYGGPFTTINALYQMGKALGTSRSDSTNISKMNRAFAAQFGMTEEHAKMIVEDSVREIFPQMERYFSPVPGAAEFLHWGRSRYVLILATNPAWLPPAVELRIQWAEIDLDWFHSYTHAGSMHSCKPSLEYYREILEQENLSPSSSLLIGDSPRKDLPASKLGIPVFLFVPDLATDRPFYKEKFLRGANAPVWYGNYLGLKALLESLP